MYRKGLPHWLCNLGFDYEPERRHMDPKFACQENGSLQESSPVFQQKISTHLRLKCKNDMINLCPSLSGGAVFH